MPAHPRMADLARIAGVSTSTVSRALTGHPRVNPETRLRIEALARSLDYSINSTAAALRSGINQTIAVVVPYEPGARQSLTDAFFLGLIGSLADVLTERGYQMLLVRTDAGELPGAGLLVRTGKAAGLVVIGQWHQHAQLNALAAQGIPLVVWGARLEGQRYCTVGSDNLQGGRLATAHLLRSGRRRVAFIGDVSLPEVEHRYQGYLAAHRVLHVPADPVLKLSEPFLPAGGLDAAQRLLALPSRCDAVFACSDVLAMALISALSAQRVRVPEEIAVVGYDDVQLAAYFSPPLDTVRQSVRAGAVALVDALLARLAGITPPSRLLPTELIARGSVRAEPSQSAH